MDIKRTLIGQNIVILIKNIKVSTFTQYWFIQNKIFLPEDINQDVSIFAPNYVKVRSQKCEINITPSQIQFIVGEDDMSQSFSIIKKVFLSFLRVASSVQPIAMGTNFIWRIESDSSSMYDLGIYLFGQAESPIYDYFMKSSARLGANFTQQYDDKTLLRLDIKPTRLGGDSSPVECFVSSFNYHRVFSSDEQFSKIEEQINKWSNMRQTSTKIVCLLK